MFKYGNKLYLLNTAFHYDYDTSFNQLFVVDSFSFIYYDIENRTENYVNINDSLIEINNKYMFLEQSKEIADVEAILNRIRGERDYSMRDIKGLTNQFLARLVGDSVDTGMSKIMSRIKKKC